MAKKYTDSHSVNPESFDGNLNNDAYRFRKRPNEWIRARNAVNNTIVGDTGDLSNEMSNYLGVTVGDPDASEPYKIIGAIHIEAATWAIFSTNNINSEIGLFKEEALKYSPLINNLNGITGESLNFSTYNLIQGVGRTAFNCGHRLYWDDGLNPTRTLDLDRLPWVQNCVDDAGRPWTNTSTGCMICNPTTVLDADKLRLAPLVTDLAFSVKQGHSSGQLINGSYYVVGAYLVEGQRVTDYSLPSNIQ